MKTDFETTGFLPRKKGRGVGWMVSKFCFLKFFNNYTKNATSNNATIFNTFIIGLIAGPAVSL